MRRKPDKFFLCPEDLLEIGTQNHPGVCGGKVGRLGVKWALLIAGNDKLGADIISSRKAV